MFGNCAFVNAVYGLCHGSWPGITEERQGACPQIKGSPYSSGLPCEALRADLSAFFNYNVCPGAIAA